MTCNPCVAAPIAPENVRPRGQRSQDALKGAGLRADAQIEFCLFFGEHRAAGLVAEHHAEVLGLKRVRVID